MTRANRSSVYIYYRLQCTATHCNTLQHTATYCNTLTRANRTCVYIYTIVYHHCNTPQHTATHCNILQHTDKSKRDVCVYIYHRIPSLLHVFQRDLKHWVKRSERSSKQWSSDLKFWIILCKLFLGRANRSCVYITGWWRLIIFFKLQVVFCKRANNSRALLRKVTYKGKASYMSSPPPCIVYVFLHWCSVLQCVVSICMCTLLQCMAVCQKYVYFYTVAV